MQLVVENAFRTVLDRSRKTSVLDPYQVELTDTPVNGVTALTTAINQYKPVPVFGPVLSNKAIGDIVVSKR